MDGYFIICQGETQIPRTLKTCQREMIKNSYGHKNYNQGQTFNQKEEIQDYPAWSQHYQITKK